MMKNRILILAFLTALFFGTYQVVSQAVYNGSSRHRFTTNYGTIDIGPMNSSWAHIYSNRPKFIFNKPIWIQGGTLSSYSSSNLLLQTNATTRMTILNSNGFVGIGTTSPGRELDVVGEIRTLDGTDRMSMNVDQAGNYSELSWGDDASDRLRFYYNHWNGTSSDREVMTLLSGGNVGIGNTNPSGKLDVNGNIKATESITVNKNGSYRIALNGQADGYIYGRNNSSENKFLITSNGNSWLNGGNVGIGTSSPDATLAVKGDIHAEEVRVDLSVPAPDYVFKEDYQLRSLQEVQAYIKTNGHLPNIPSAKEMETHGVELGAMEMKLLEKIEELTLYLFEQQKQYAELEKRTQKLEQQLKMK